MGSSDPRSSGDGSTGAGLTTIEAAQRLAHDGPNEVPEQRRHPLLAFARRFWGLSAWMLELIAVLSFALHKAADAWIAVALLAVNAVLGAAQEQRASAAVAALKARLQVTARVKRDARWGVVPARDLVVGDVVRLRAGDFVPADVTIASGTVRVDESALTGESQDVERSPDATIHSGSIIRIGEATAVVVATGMKTRFGQTAQLVETARPKLHVEAVIGRVVGWLFLIVGTLTAVTVVLSILRGGSLVEILPLSLVLLMSAVPIALPVMFTVSMAVGAMELGRRGVLISRLGAIEDAANMDVLCADKTGTLTQNRLTLTGVLPRTGATDAEVIAAGALASSEADADPIDLAFLRASRDRGLATTGVATISFTPFSAESRRTEAEVDVAGRRARVVKGALRTVASLAGLDAATIASLEGEALREAQKGMRVLAVGRSEDGGPLRLLGLALLMDAPRPDSSRLIDELRALGVGVKMLTGDALPVAAEIARGLGLGAIIRAPDLRAQSAAGEATVAKLADGSGGFAEIFPEDKFVVVRSLQAAGHVVGMTGDGVNDAPALKQAEVGIAVSTATDVAKGAASVVLTSEGLVNIVDLVRHGRAVYQRVLTWILNKVSRTILKAGFVVVAFLATGRFVISALGMVLLVFLTDFAKVALATDRVPPVAAPTSWRIGRAVRGAIVLGLLMLVESLALLAIGWRRWSIASHPAQMRSFSFLVLLFFAVFSIVSIRERRAWWRSLPSAPLAAALAADLLIGWAIGAHGIGELGALPWTTSLVIFASAAACCLGVNDIVKIAVVPDRSSR